MNKAVVRVPERGRIELDQAVWQRVVVSQVFWGLVEKGVISVEYPAANRVFLSGSCYVGRALLSENLIIEVYEKIEGALAALLRHTTRKSFKVEKLSAPASELGPLIGLLSAQFVEVLRRYVSRGREFVYSSKSHVGSLVGGKINVTGTARLHARGWKHLVQFQKNIVVHNTPFNRVALSALREVDNLSRLVTIDQDALAHSRALSILFSDCRDNSVLFGARSELVRIAQNLEATSKNEKRKDVLALAILLLSHESFEHSSVTGSTSPRTWFLNLENLFETAVRNIMGIVANAKVVISPGRESSMQVFPAISTKEYSANPDIVIRQAKSILAVGDVKYKGTDKGPSASDLYQLIVHATAFQSKEAFLVYPGDTFSYTDLGVSTAGPHVRVFNIDVRTLFLHIHKILTILDVPAAYSYTEMDVV